MPRQIIECIADAVLPQLAPTAVELDNKISLGVGCVDTLDHFGGDLTAMVEDAVSVQRVKPVVGAVGQHSQLPTGLTLPVCRGNSGRSGLSWSWRMVTMRGRRASGLFSEIPIFDSAAEGLELG